MSKPTHPPRFKCKRSEILTWTWHIWQPPHSGRSLLPWLSWHCCLHILLLPSFSSILKLSPPFRFEMHKFLIWAQFSFYSVKTLAHVLSHFSHVRLFVTLWTVAHQAPLPMGLSRQEYWNGLPFPPPGQFSSFWINAPGLKWSEWWQIWISSLNLFSGLLTHMPLESKGNHSESKSICSLVGLFTYKYPFWPSFSSVSHFS